MHSLITGLNFLLQNVPNESFTYSQIANDPYPKHYVPVGVCICICFLSVTYSALIG